jgi:5-(carboxyamino)imidazole ribonucleotide mutase
MPTGVPVATVGVGNAANAGLLAARILAVSDPAIAARLAAQIAESEASVLDHDRELRDQH